MADLTFTLKDLDISSLDKTILIPDSHISTNAEITYKSSIPENAIGLSGKKKDKKLSDKKKSKSVLQFIASESEDNKTEEITRPPDPVLLKEACEWGEGCKTISEIDNTVKKSSVKKNPRKKNDNEQDLRNITTSLEKLGISSVKRESFSTICWGDYYKIKIFITPSDNRDKFELTPNMRIKCRNCHLFPPEGALMLGVPFKYTASYIDRHIYSPECVNIIKSMEVSKSVIPVKLDNKTILKTNYFRHEMTKNAEEQLDKTVLTSLREKGYFDAAYPVCSFGCMVAKGRELARFDTRFKNVNTLINMLYHSMFGTWPPEPILPSPSYELLEEYGGPLSEEEYRNGVEYVNTQDSGQLAMNHSVKIGKININSNLFINILQ